MHSIREAVSRVIGVETVRSLALAMAIRQSFNSNKCPRFDATRFWIQALLTAECCKKLVSADGSATDACRDLAYAAGLCHNLGLMALAHMEPDSTSSVLRAHSENFQSGNLGGLFYQQFETDHRFVTLELARLWSLPEPMVAAYRHRAMQDSTSHDRLALIVAAGAALVGNTEVDEDQQTDLDQWAQTFDLMPEILQEMAVIGDRQKERVQSLASTMAG